MFHLFQSLLTDQAGFIVSSELVLVSSIGVMGMTAGLSEVSNNVNGELKDVGTAIRHIGQSNSYAQTGGNGSPLSEIGR